MSDSSHKFIKRNRPPRVHITYEDPYERGAQSRVALRYGVMADLSATPRRSRKPEMATVSFFDIDMDNIDQRMSAIDPGCDSMSRIDSRQQE